MPLLVSTSFWAWYFGWVQISAIANSDVLISVFNLPQSWVPKNGSQKLEKLLVLTEQDKIKRSVRVGF